MNEMFHLFVTYSAPASAKLRRRRIPQGFGSSSREPSGAGGYGAEFSCHLSERPRFSVPNLVS